MERQINKGAEKTGLNTEKLSLSEETTARRDGRGWRENKLKTRKEIEEREKEEWTFKPKSSKLI